VDVALLDAVVGENEPDRVIDVPGGDLVGREQQRRDREPGGIGARALLAAQATAVLRARVPSGEAAALEGARDVRAPHLEQPPRGLVEHQEMAVPIASTRVAVLAFDVATRRHRQVDVIAIGRVEVRGRRERTHRRARVGDEDVDREIDLHEIPVAPPALGSQRGDLLGAGRRGRDPGDVVVEEHRRLEVRTLRAGWRIDPRIAAEVRVVAGATAARPGQQHPRDDRSPHDRNANTFPVNDNRKNSQAGALSRDYLPLRRR
jgi:hypothetical protein